MSSEIIKEFLVSLGYKVDGNSQRKFVDGAQVASKEVAALGAAAIAAAAAVTAAVSKMASNLDELYFSSQRTRASAENIKALGFAADQMGSSADAASGSLESFAKFLRTNPGGESLIRSWGIDTRRTNGELRDTTEMLGDLGKLFRTMSYPQAYARANALGIDEKTLMALIKGTEDFSARYKEILHRYGLDVDKAAEQSHKFMLRLRDVKANAEVLSTVIGTKLIGIFDELEYRWNSLDEATKQNIETGAKWVAGIVAGAAIIASGPIGIIGALAAAIVALWDDYKVWKEGGKSLIDWGKWKPEIDLAKSGIDLISDGLANLAKIYQTAWPHIVEGWHDFTGAVKEAYDWVMKLFKVVENSKTMQWVIQHTQSTRDAVADAYGKAYDWIKPKIAPLAPGQKTMGDLGAFGHAATQLWNQITGKTYEHGAPDAQTGQPSASSGDARGIRNNNPGNLIYNGFTRGLGATGQDEQGFAIFATPQEGLNAIAANLASYARKGFNTPSEIAHRWSATDQDAYTTHLAGLFGGDPNKALDLSDPNVIRALQNGIVTQENGSNPYGQEMLGSQADQSPAASAANGPSLSQVTHITVSGTTDPKSMASAIGNEQKDVNQRLVRNFQSAAAL